MESFTAYILKTLDRLSREDARGFTLVEMMVVLSIIVIITVITLVGQSSFNRSLVLTDTAYTVAFSIREAQALGISSRAFADGTTNAGYGVRFASAPAGSYALFADVHPTKAGNIQNVSVCPGHTVGTGPEARPGDCRQTQASEIVRTYTLNNGYKVSGFCGNNTGGVEWCNGGNSSSLAAIDITYLRPNTQSVILGTRTNGAIIVLTNAVIRVSTPAGIEERCILVSKVGQVSVLSEGVSGCPTK